MRAYVIILEHLVQFLWHDNDFFERLKCLYQDADVQPSVDPVENAHLIEELLAPIVLSYSLLENNFDETCSVIKCSKIECDIVFQQHNNLLYLGFCNGSEFSIYNMQKQLHVLHELTEFFFGPCQQNIKPLNLIDKSRTWSKLTQALQSFIELHEKDQSFLVGGIERLQLNPDLQLLYSNTIESYMKILSQKLDTERITFGILFVRNKVVAYEIGAKFKHEISSADLLKIMTLINSKYKEVELDTMLDASSAADAFELSWSDEEGSSQDQFSTTPSYDEDQDQKNASIKETRRKTSSAMKVPVAKVTFLDDGNPSSLSNTPQDGAAGARHIKVKHSQSWHGNISMLKAYSPPTIDKKPAHHHIDVLTATQIALTSLEDSCVEDSHSSEGDTTEILVTFPRRAVLPRRMTFPAVVTEIPSGDIQQQTPRRNIQTFPVFLQTVSCRHTPFLMHLIQIAEDATFVLLAEMKGGDVAHMICVFLLLLKKIKFRSGRSVAGIHGSIILEIDGGQKTFDMLGSCCRRLRSRLSHASDQQLQRIIGLWEGNISWRLLTHIKQKKSSALPRLEQNISDLTKNLQSLFHRLFLVKPHKSKKSWKEQVSVVATEMEKRLSDHLEFFRAKAYRNISFNWNKEKYPGMLHFILIKRLKTPRGFGGLTGSGMPLVDEVFSSGFCTPPASEDNGEIIDEYLVLCLKNNIWKGIMTAYSNLLDKEGVSEFSATDRDFRFTSYIWARPTNAQGASQLSGLREKLKDFQWKGKASVTGVESPFWSVRSISDAAGPFIFFELHLVHFSTVPRSMILEQSSRLVAGFKESQFDT